VSFDPAKDAANIAKHGLSLERAWDMEVAAIIEDDRYDYGEVRTRAFGLIDGLPHCLAFAMRQGEPRPISLRRVHLKEYKRYVRQTEGD
jgi:uncharacterized protein